MEPSHIRVH